MNIQQIRREGLGNGFRVIDPHDGFRKNDQLWFGKCSECEATVTNSSLDGVWQHTIYTHIEYWGDSRFPNSTQSHQATYCPKVEGKVVEPVVTRKELA
jgi:hypothetical protein